MQLEKKILIFGGKLRVSSTRYTKRIQWPCFHPRSIYAEPKVQRHESKIKCLRKVSLDAQIIKVEQSKFQRFEQN